MAAHEAEVLVEPSDGGTITPEPIARIRDCAREPASGPRSFHADQSAVSCDMIALEPAQSPLLTTGVGGPHRVEGIGVGFEPPFLDRGRCREIRTVDENDAMVMARRLASEEGLLCGTSTGLNVCAALELANELGPEHTVVTLGSDSGTKYLAGELFATAGPELD